MGDCLHFFEGWSKWIFCASFELKNELGASCEGHRIKPGQLVFWECRAQRTWPFFSGGALGYSEGSDKHWFRLERLSPCWVNREGIYPALRSGEGLTSIKELPNGLLLTIWPRSRKLAYYLIFSGNNNLFSNYCWIVLSIEEKKLLLTLGWELCLWYKLIVDRWTEESQVY